MLANGVAAQVSVAGQCSTVWLRVRHGVDADLCTRTSAMLGPLFRYMFKYLMLRMLVHTCVQQRAGDNERQCSVDAWCVQLAAAALHTVPAH